ncbi:DnaJ sub A member 2 [Coemansia sp. RSA 1813]|nr:DnaJ sub A member 2 [Coemansia sp. RSA 1646]KAJ1766754.1 DnaJ sub A member 2 [Coemansia sp. RSA 1843]KAJ2089397.1 DnaJ sub A member 2 [Coemansia sp. RSA 986]KAJ2210566.1 DnaJ sub A member 2 [Coemansia sp. RSA 487]KAJ2568248.1 DnaJ sub A member 2 [Coemansia sp. RSA 1813]
MSTMRSYYEVLELDETATDAEIKRAYRRLAMKYHPDKNSEGAELFKEISHAYETLNDPEKRALYDQYGATGQPDPEMYGSEFDMNDIYAEMFGGGMFGASGSGSGPQREPRVEQHPLSVSLEELFRGKKMRMKLERSVPCGRCKGLGGKKKAFKDCVECGGKGSRMAARKVGPVHFTHQMMICQRCKGTGKVVPEKYLCRKCKGSCTEKQNESVEIKIDPGMADGQKIVLKGKGDQSPGTKEPLDLVFVLQQKPHSTFTRSGDHLIASAEIDLAEALCGFSRVLFTHLDGRLVMVSHKDSILHPGEFLCINNEGMPREQSPRVRGDLFIKVSIKFPEKGWNPDPELRRLLPSTCRPNDTPVTSDDADIEVSVAHSLPEQVFESRTKQKESSRRQYYDDDDEYESNYTGMHGNAVPECQAQ